MAQDSEKNISFEMTDADMQDITEAQSEAVPNVQLFGKTAFTIENAPIPKSVRDTLGVEKTVKVEFKVKMDREQK